MMKIIERIFYWMAYIITKILCVLCPPFKRWGRKKILAKIEGRS